MAFRFVTGEGSDFTIECEGRNFAVHKFILMAHSDVFRAMFKHTGTIENRDSKLILTDTNPVAVNQMLTYMVRNLNNTLKIPSFFSTLVHCPKTSSTSMLLL